MAYRELLRFRFVARRAEFVADVQSRQSVGVGHVAGHVQDELSQHDEAGEVPFRFEFILRRVVRLVVDLR